MTALLVIALSGCTPSGPAPAPAPPTASSSGETPGAPPAQLPEPFNDVTTGWSVAHADDDTVVLINPETGKRFDAGKVVGTSPGPEDSSQDKALPGWRLVDVSATGQRALFVDDSTFDVMVYDLVQRRELTKLSPGQHQGAIFTRPEADGVFIFGEKNFERRSIADGKVAIPKGQSNKPAWVGMALPGGYAVIDESQDGPWLIRDPSTGDLIREATPPGGDKFDCRVTGWVSPTQAGVTCDPTGEGTTRVLVLGIEEGRFYTIDPPAAPSANLGWSGVIGDGTTTVLTASEACNVSHLAAGDLNNLKAAQPISLKGENVPDGPYSIVGVAGGWLVARLAGGCHAEGQSGLISYRLESKTAKLLVDSKTPLRTVVMVTAVEQ